MEKSLWNHVLRVREKSPLVQNITNFVVMNNTANALLAVGASPIMAHAKEELVEMVGICQALVINIGTLDEFWVKSMLQAAKTANSLKKPFVLDPVGAGATSYRDTVLSGLMNLKPTVIRGNASEILALANANLSTTKGVDSTAESNEAIEAAKNLNKKFGAIICISGATDIIVDQKQEYHLNNGNALMTKVTGLGCSSTAIIGAFVAAIENKVEAVVAATALMSIAGEIAAEKADGPGSLQMMLLDKLYNITETEFLSHIRLSQIG